MLGCSSGSSTSGTGGTAGAGGSAGVGGVPGNGGDGTGGTAGSGGANDLAVISVMVDSVDPSRYEMDLNALAVVRNYGSQAWLDAQTRCADTLEALGFDVELQSYGSGVNVIGTKPGLSESQLVLSAHYDAVPNCEGADDNASGVAGALEAARVLSTNDYEHTLVVACWDEEEVGLVGAAAYAQEAREDDVDIIGMYSLEMIGYISDEPNSQQLPVGIDLLFPEQTAMLEANEFRGDFIAIVSDTRSRALNDAFERYADEVGLPWLELEVPDVILTTPLAADLQRSDHAAFWFSSYPGVMLTDSANFRNQNYHCIGGPDTTDRLDTNFSVGVIKAAVGAVATVLDVR
jgi:hypothetical protein